MNKHTLAKQLLKAAELLAAFDAPEVTWSGNEAMFDVLGKDGSTTQFVVQFKREHITHKDLGRVEGYDVGFMLKKHKGDYFQYSLTGDSNISPFKVFGGVLEALRQFIEREQPNALWFVADEKSRAKLYARMVKRMSLPAGYTGEVSDEGEYLIAKDDFKAKRLKEVGDDSPRRKKQLKQERVTKALKPFIEKWMEEAIEHDYGPGEFEEDLLLHELDVEIPQVNMKLVDKYKGREFRLELAYDELAFTT